MDKINVLMDLIGAQIAMLLVLAGTVERITEFVKMGVMTYTKKDLPVYAKQILVVAISIIFCLTTETQFNVGLTVPTFVNEIIAGLLISFGSDSLHAILGFVRSAKDTNEAKTEAVSDCNKTVIITASDITDTKSVG